VTCLRVDNRVLSEMLSRRSASGYEVEELALGESDDWMEQLLGSRVMHLMPNANLQEVLRKMERVELAAGQEVFHQGDEGDYYYFINRGRCGLTRSEGKGEETEIAQLGPGESFGEDALLSGSPRSCTIRMLSDGVLIRLSKENFEQLIKQPLSRVLGYGEARRHVAAGAVWMDVRSASAYEAGHLAGSVNLPFDLLRYQMDSLAADREYIVYCEDASVSTAAAYLLTERNFQVSVLKRGLRAVPKRDLHRTAEAEAPGEQVVTTRTAAAASVMETPVVTGAAVSLQDYRDQGETGPQGRIQALELALTESKQRSQELEVELAKARTCSQELEAELLQAKQHNLALEGERATGERRIDELAQRYEADLEKLRNDLAAARNAAAVTSLATKADSAEEILHLKQALNHAEAQRNKLSAELDQAEDRHIAETDEVHQLWEKRLRQLEQDIEQVRAERDEWRQRSQERAGE
jgi:CRP-like cAMP-binding protein